MSDMDIGTTTATFYPASTESTQARPGDGSSMPKSRKYSRIVDGSCWSCRRRRIKCDLSRPTCAHCVQSATACDYGSKPPVRWVGGSISRARSARRQSTSTSPSPCLERCTKDALISKQDVLRIDRLPKKPEILAPGQEELLLYFANAVLPRFQLLDIVLPVDMSHVFGDEPLKRAMLAVSQAHLEHCSPISSDRALTRRREARSTAMETLRQSLSVGVNDSKEAQALFVVNVLLCMLDGMIDPLTEQPGASIWHLKGGYAMLDRWKAVSTSLLATGGLGAHLLSVFATMDLVYALLSGASPYFDPLLWHMFAGTQAWWGNLHSGDRFLRSLQTFSELAFLGHLVKSHLPSLDGAQLAQKCLPALSISGCTVSTPAERSYLQTCQQWEDFCELYEISCTIYVNRAIYLRSVDHPNVQAATRRGVEMLVDQVLPGMMAHCAILPILIIGAHAIHSQDRNAVLQALAPSVSYLAFGNLQRMVDWLKEFWRQPTREVDWWQQFEGIADKVFLF